MRAALTVLSLMLAFALANANAAVPMSEFIGKMPPLTPDAQRAWAYIYIAPGKTLKGFDRVALDPVLVWFAPDSKYRGVGPNELAAVANGMESLAVGEARKVKISWNEIGEVLDAWA